MELKSSAWMPRVSNHAQQLFYNWQRSNLLNLGGSFKIGEDIKPLVISLDFPALPTENGRASKLIEHGI